MNVKDYLSTLGRDTIERAYLAVGAPPYNDEADRKVSARLTARAAEDGLSLVIGPATLGRYRSEVGLVGRKIAREPAPAQPTAEPQLPLSPPIPDLATIGKALASIESALWAIHGLLKRSSLVSVSERLAAMAEGDQPS